MARTIQCANGAQLTYDGERQTIEVCMGPGAGGKPFFLQDPVDVREFFSELMLH